MSVKVDVSGFEQLLQTLGGAIEKIPVVNKEFMEEEFGRFVDKVVPESPYDSGNLANSYRLGDIEQAGTETKADWMNTARGEPSVNHPDGFPYARKVNYETAVDVPTYFWERGMDAAEAGREKRYQDKAKTLFTKGGE